MPLAEILRFHAGHTVIGIALTALTLYSSVTLFLWMLPASLGLVFSGPLSAFSARRSAGDCFRRLGLLGIAEEKKPPAVATEAEEARRRLAQGSEHAEAITQLVRNPQLRRLHRELVQMQPITLESRISPNLAIGRAKLEVSANLDELLSLLKPGEKTALLSDPESLARLEIFILAEIPPETPSQSAEPLKEVS